MEATTSHPSGGVPRIVIIWNAFLSWTAEELKEQIDDIMAVRDHLCCFGYEAVDMCLLDSFRKSVFDAGFGPSEWLILNMASGYTNVFAEQEAVIEELEALKYVFTGPGSQVVRTCRNKGLIRTQLSRNGIRVPPGILVTAPGNVKWSRFPAIIKPCGQHCSIGIDTDSLVFNRMELKRQLERLYEGSHAPMIIEEFIEGREFTVSVWGNGVPEVLHPVEFDFSAFKNPRERILIYRYKFSYFDDKEPYVYYLAPAMLEIGDLAMIQAECLRAYQAAGCRDCARLDLRFRDGKVYFIDINPNPDLEPDSTFAITAQSVGIEYGYMLARMIDFAKDRWPR
jgi:D-alanine-D-alanine ligase